MKRCIYFAIFVFLPAFVFAQKVVSITVDGSINPTSAEYISKAIDKAAVENAECFLLHLNTPGGLLTSTRTIVSKMLTAAVPVVVYVSPAGAHAGSAGVFITLAANIAAMAPGTNIGAAHPVSLQGSPDSIMNAKGTNDAAAFISTIARRRNRNMQWAQEAVRNSVAINEEEAIEQNVVDYIAGNDRELLTKIDGKAVQVNGATKILHTRHAAVEVYEMGFFQKILDKLSDPNIAYMLMMIGFYGILFELFSPGAIFPGIVGVIALIFGLYAMSNLPVNYAGLSLIIFGIVLFVLDIKITSHGLLTIGGIAAVLSGSLFLFRTSPAETFIAVSWTVIIAATAITALFFLFVAGMGLKAQQTKPVMGMHALTGLTGEAIDTLSPNGTAKVNGEIWKAIALSDNIEAGEKIVVKAIKDLTLHVEKAQA